MSMSVRKFLQIVALTTTLSAQADNMSFKNIDQSGSVVYIPIRECKNLSKFLPNTTIPQIKIIGWVPVLHENSVSNVKNVEKIIFEWNGIEEIQPGAFKNFEGVKMMKITKNNLTVIKTGTFEDLPLEQLDLSDNTIEKIEAGAFGNLPNLKELDLKNNSIAHLQSDVFDGLSMERLDLSFNLLSTIPENFLDNLEVRQIYFQRTKLTTIPGGVFTNNPNLKKVCLALNDISFVASDAFDNMPNLEEVDLSVNNLIKLDPNWFHNSPNINRLNFHANSIEEIPDGAFRGNFTKIDLSFNRINRILSEAFKGVRRIETLDLSHNDIDKWNSSFLESVEQIDTLDLSFNEIKCFEGSLDDVFKANVTWVVNPFDDECLARINEWNTVHGLQERKVYTQIC